MPKTVIFLPYETRSHFFVDQIKSPGIPLQLFTVYFTFPESLHVEAKIYSSLKNQDRVFFHFLNVGYFQKFDLCFHKLVQLHQLSIK